MPRKRKLKPNLQKLKSFKNLHLTIPKVKNKYKQEILFNTDLHTQRDENTRQTKPEMLIKIILEKEHIPYVREFPLMGKYYDFKVEYKNHEILVEMDGRYWHDFGGLSDEIRIIRNRCNDLVKNAIAKSHGFPLIRIWDDEINTEEILNKLDKIISELEDEK